MKKILATRYSLNSNKGFTLIELLVAIGVIAVVSSFVFANVNSKQKNLSRSAQKLALDIRRAQNLSLAPSDSPVCIYGLKINSPTDYFLYRDATCASGKAYGASSVLVDGQNISLESGVTIANAAGQDAAFEAPEPITYLNGVTGATPMVITLQSATATKNIVINRFGRVEIQ